MVAERNMADIMRYVFTNIFAFTRETLFATKDTVDSGFKIHIYVARVCIRMCFTLSRNLLALFLFHFISFFFVAHFISMCNNNTYFVLALVRTYQHNLYASSLNVCVCVYGFDVYVSHSETRELWHK